MQEANAECEKSACKLTHYSCDMCEPLPKDLRGDKILIVQSLACKGYNSQFTWENQDISKEWPRIDLPSQLLQPLGVRP